MRSFVLASAALGLVAAAPAPRPQDIDFDLANALPNPTYTVVSDATAQTVSYTPTAIFASALPQITSTVSDDSLATTTDSANKVKRTACAVQPSGYGPVPSPDTAAAFLADPDFASAAIAAPVPSGYTQTFSNLTASNNALGYLGYTTLKSYDTVGCAAKCNAINGCMSVNVYYERDPSVDPGSGSSGCSNPSSTTTIKCVFWGGPINPGNANNAGQWRNQFQVVIAGSNGYVNNTIAQVPGYGTAVDLGTAAINAPYDADGFNSYMGSAIFSNGPFNASLCAQACSAKSAYALAHPPTDGTPVQTCQFFNTYILYINNTANPNSIQGQYCAMYSETWSSKYATNVGQYRGSDHYLIEYSYAYSNTTNPGAVNAVAAEYQARNDILWPGNSALPYCSSVLGYTTPVTTTTVTATVTPTTTVVVSTTVTANAKRQATPAPGSAVPLPAILSKYPASIVTAACSLASASVTQPPTSTVTVSTTQTASPATVTSTSTVSACYTSLPTSQFYVLQADYNGKYAVVSDGESGDVTFTSSTETYATQFSIDSNMNLIDESIDASGTILGYIANEDAGADNENVYFNSLSSIQNNGYATLSCKVTCSMVLSCTVNGNSVNSRIPGTTQPDTWYIGSSLLSDETAITISVLPYGGD